MAGWHCPGSLFPAEETDTILTRDLEGTDLRTKANTRRIEELQNAREGPALSDIHDLMQEAEPTLPQPAKVL